MAIPGSPPCDAWWGVTSRRDSTSDSVGPPCKADLSADMGPRRSRPWIICAKLPSMMGQHSWTAGGHLSR
jgi:hypothetical protein